jgi:hypothetical protein
MIHRDASDHHDDPTADGRENGENAESGPAGAPRLSGRLSRFTGKFPLPVSLSPAVTRSAASAVIQVIRVGHGVRLSESLAAGGPGPDAARHSGTITAGSGPWPGPSLWHILSAAQ